MKYSHLPPIIHHIYLSWQVLPLASYYAYLNDRILVEY